jgi:hypothetical protein
MGVTGFLGLVAVLFGYTTVDRRPRVIIDGEA